MSKYGKKLAEKLADMDYFAYLCQKITGFFNNNHKFLDYEKDSISNNHYADKSVGKCSTEDWWT